MNTHPTDLSEQSLARILHHAPDAICAKDVHGRYMSVNKAASEILGIPSDKMIGRTDGELDFPDAETVSELDRRVMSGETVEPHYFSFVVKGRLKYFQTDRACMDDDNGAVTGVVTVTRDVTQDHLETEKYRYIFENAPIGFWEEDFSEVKKSLDAWREKGVTDFHGFFMERPEELDRCIDLIRVINVNRACAEMNGVSDRELLLGTLERNFDKGYERVYVEELAALADGETSYEAECDFINDQRKKLHVLLKLNVLPGHENDLSHVLVSVIDLTEMKRLSTELSAAQMRYQSIVEEQREMIARIGPNGRTSFRNKAFERFFNHRDPYGELRFVALFPPSEVQRLEKMMTGLKPTAFTFTTVARNYDTNGQLVWQDWTVTAFYDRSGRLLSYQAVGADVTDKTMTQEALAASEARWRTIFDHAADLIATVNVEGRVLSVNDHEELRGLRWAGKRLEDVMVPENAANAMMHIHEVFTTGRPKKLEFRYVSSGGEVRFYGCNISPIYHHERVLTVLIIARNISEAKVYEKQTRAALMEGEEQERKRIAQELHDGLGQLFTAMKMNLQDLEQHMDGKGGQQVSEQFKYLEQQIGTAMNEVRNISRNLMPDVLWQFGLAPALEDLIRKWNALEGLKVQLQIVDIQGRFAPEMENTVYRILQELITNSVRHGKATDIFVQLIDHGDELLLMVEDNGNGFDPGTAFSGSGLRNIRSRAERFDGTMTIDSAVGADTVMTIAIPLTPELRA